MGGDEVVEVQLAATVELHQTRHVGAEAIGAHRRALYALLAQEVEAVKLDLHAEGHHADDRGRAAVAQHLERLLGRLLEAEAFDGVMHPVRRLAAEQVADLLDGIAVARD